MLTGQVKKDYQREYMRSYMRKHRGLNNEVLTDKVLTDKKCLDPVLETIRESKGLTVKTQASVRPGSSNLEPPIQQQEVIKPLKEQISTPKENKPLLLCLRCLKIGKTIQAIGQYEITTDTGERYIALCGRCREKTLIYC